MRPLPLVALALAPVLALGVFFYARSHRGRAGFSGLIWTFLLGAAILVPAAAISITLENLTGWTPRTPSLLGRFVGAMLIVALVEESWKFLVVRLYAYDRPDFDEPYDGIMYSVVAALGFATVENLLYVLSGGFGVGVLRALLAVPGHAFYGVLMGYFLGEAKFAGRRARAFWFQLVGFGLAVLAHGVYDFVVFSLDRRPLLILVLPVYALLSWVVFFQATRRHAKQSFRRHPALRDWSSDPGEKDR